MFYVSYYESCKRYCLWFIKINYLCLLKLLIRNNFKSIHNRKSIISSLSWTWFIYVTISSDYRSIWLLITRDYRKICDRLQMITGYNHPILDWGPAVLDSGPDHTSTASCLGLCTSALRPAYVSTRDGAEHQGKHSRPPSLPVSYSHLASRRSATPIFDSVMRSVA